MKNNMENEMQTRKIVINTCFGGFSLSDKALAMFADRAGLVLSQIFPWEIDRADPELVHVVEMLGKDANGSHARLKVVEIPADVAWKIEEHDGVEHIAEVHRTWW